MLPERNAVHSVAQMYAVQSNSFYYDRPKNSNHYCDETNAGGHRKCHYPVTEFDVGEVLTDASSKDQCRQYIPNTKAEDHRCVGNKISLGAVLTNNGEIDTMMLCDTLVELVSAFILFLAPFRPVTEVHIGPSNRHIFGGDRVEAQMPSI